MKICSDQEFLDSNFFVISSDNLDTVNSRLYGYAIFSESDDNKYDIFINGSLDYIPVSADGAYINVVCNSENIDIQQDCNGSYGLYLYQKDGYFAISNSYLYLLDYLKHRVKLSLNQDYVKYYIAEPLATLSVSETLINEIELLPKDIKVKIDLSSKDLTTIISVKEQTKISLNTQEGIDLLDKWYHKWQSILLTLQQNNEKVRVDLTGGMDSRAAFCIFNHPSVNMENILVNSSTMKLHTHEEDYEIASIIADRMNFQLNRYDLFNVNQIRIPSELSIKMAFYAKLGTHKKFYLKTNYISERMFYFTGFGGESIRRHWYMKPREFVNRQASNRMFRTVDNQSSIKKIVSKSIEDIKKYYKDDTDVAIMRNLYQNTRLRSHFGKNIVENFLGKTINMNPLMDPELQRIHTNDDTLLSVIYDRYFHQVNDVKFEGGRGLNKSAIENAKIINSTFPYVEKLKMIGQTRVVDKTQVQPESEELPGKIRSQMVDKLRCEEIKQLITSVLGQEVYQKALNDWDKGGFAPDLLASALLAVVVSLEATQSTPFFHPNKNTKLYSNSKIINDILDIFRVARIDIKNVGDETNDLQFPVNSDFNIISPPWFKGNGTGYIITSKNLILKTKFKCVNSGNLEIKLKGLNVEDSNKQRIPSWVDFTSCTINGSEYVEEVTSVWHDRPLSISRPVKDGEEIDLVMTWKVHDYEMSEFMAKIEKYIEVL